MWDFLKQLTDPQSIIQYGGLALLLIVVFAETGLFIGFFLPGDSLIFVSGMFCSTKAEIMQTNIVVLLLLLTTAAFLGNMAGYWFGKKSGPALFKRDDSLIFKKRYLEMTRSFYEKNGGKTIVLGRFLPIIRTFAPILAGAINVDVRKFMLYNIIGAVCWIFPTGFAGFYLGKIAWVERNVGWVIIALIIVTLIPLFGLRRKTPRS